MDIRALTKDFVAACSSMILKVRSEAGITATLCHKRCQTMFMWGVPGLCVRRPLIVKVKQQSLAADSQDKQQGNKANSQPRTSHVHGLLVMLERVSFDIIHLPRRQVILRPS